MTLEEAIKYCEEVAENYKNQTEPECQECASEHRQLAEWLRELKGLRESRSLQWWLKQCDTCRYRSCQPEQRPCNRCCHNYKNKWEYDNTREQNTEEVNADGDSN